MQSRWPCRNPRARARPAAGCWWSRGRALPFGLQQEESADALPSGSAPDVDGDTVRVSSTRCVAKPNTTTSSSRRPVATKNASPPFMAFALKIRRESGNPSRHHRCRIAGRADRRNRIAMRLGDGLGVGWARGPNLDRTEVRATVIGLKSSERFLPIRPSGFRSRAGSHRGR